MAVRLSDDARRVLDAMGQGMRLRLPHNSGEEPSVVEGLARHGRNRPPFFVSPLCVAELQASNCIGKLTEHRNGEKLGWRECGYDGDAADWYALIQ